MRLDEIDVGLRGKQARSFACEFAKKSHAEAKVGCVKERDGFRSFAKSCEVIGRQPRRADYERALQVERSLHRAGEGWGQGNLDVQIERLGLDVVGERQSERR